MQILFVVGSGSLGGCRRRVLVRFGRMLLGDLRVLCLGRCCGLGGILRGYLLCVFGLVGGGRVEGGRMVGMEVFRLGKVLFLEEDNL